MYFVYILECEDGTLYTGITTDVERRLQEHREGIGSHYTRTHKAKNIVYTEEVANRSTASKREAHIKKLSRTQKKSLIIDRVE